MSRTRNVLHGAGIVGLLAAIGFSALAVGASCIIPDTGIQVHEKGYSWCTRTVGAEAWTNPNFRTLVLGTDQQPVKGCECIDNEEDRELLEKWVDVPGGPPELDADYNHYDILREKIHLKAREACQERADLIGSNNNCEDVLTDDNVLFSDGRSNDCRLKALYADTDTDTDSIDPNPFDLSGLSCSAGVCTAPQALIDDMLDRPSAFGLDSTRVELKSDGLYFTDVEQSDVAYIAGVRSGDKLLTVNGNTISGVDDVAEALVDLAHSNGATATLKDAYGSTVTLTLRIR